MNDPIYENEDPDRYLYHYTKFETTLKILQSKKLRFNNFGTSNDPYETKKLHFSVYTNTINPKPKSTLEMLKKCDTEFASIINFYKILCFCKDTRPITNNSLLNKGLSKLRMWEQYAEKHHGACLVIDSVIFNRKIRSIYQRKAVFDSISYENLFSPESHIKRANVSTLYLNEDNTNIRDALKSNIDAYPKELFFIKDADWEHESEFRYVILDINPKEERFIDISDSLRGIIIGHDVCDEYKNILLNMCNESGIFLKKLMFSDYFFLEDILIS